MYITYLSTKDKCKCELEAHMSNDDYLPDFIIWNKYDEECYCELCGEIDLPKQLGYYTCAGKCKCINCECI